MTGQARQDRESILRTQARLLELGTLVEKLEERVKSLEKNLGKLKMYENFNCV